MTSEGDDLVEVVELAVHPSAHGHGIGTALLAAILRGRGERRAALQTYDVDGPAMRIDERAGFRRLTSTQVGIAMVKHLC